jgi:hypothetical protein
MIGIINERLGKIIMKVSYKAQRIETVTKEVPDHFGHDVSRRGRIVDILLDGNQRDDLYSDQESVVKRAIYDLDSAYDKATKILTIFCEVLEANQ